MLFYVVKEKLWWFERRKGKIVVIRIRLGQYNEGFLFMEEAFVVLWAQWKSTVDVFFVS